MRKKLILAVSVSIFTGLSSLSSLSVFAQSQTHQQKVALAIGKPIVSDNLTVFLIRGNGDLKNQSPMTLQEALSKNKVRVHETGDVNTLQIENSSDAAVFIQSGDIVKGGRQDRTMQYDMILPPHSGMLPLPAFCVEHGRWSQRAAERADRFSHSDNALVGKDLKLAARQVGSQQQVWDKVAEGTGQMYHQALASLPAAPPAVSSGGLAALGPVEARLAQSNPTGSLEIALENKNVTAAADVQVKKLLHVVDGDNTIVGFAFAINGKLNSADVYGSNQLFLKMWPKELKSAVVEAIENRNDKIKSPSIATGDVEKVLYVGKPQQSKEHSVNTRTKLIDQETKDSLMFQTIDKSSGAVVHQSYFVK